MAVFVMRDSELREETLREALALPTPPVPLVPALTAGVGAGVGLRRGGRP